MPENVLQKNLNELLFYVVKVGFHSSPNLENKVAKIYMYRLEDILKLKQKELENTLFTFNKRLAMKSLNNDLQDFIKKQDNNKIKDFEVFKIVKVNLKSQIREQLHEPEILLRLTDDS